MAGLRASFNTGLTKNLHKRAHELSQLHLLLNENQPKIFEAMKEDLNKAGTESYLTEVVA